MLAEDAYDRGYAEVQLARSRSPWRRFVKRYYLAQILAEVRGPTIDFGCGAGQLLEKLPPGSLGLEVNPYLVQALAAKGLNVRRYEPGDENLGFSGLKPNHFGTFVMAHVLEHFENAARELQRILASCSRLGIERVIIVVPGKRGYRFDRTHRTFVDQEYLSTNGLLRCQGYHVSNLSYFPVNLEALGTVFTFHEMKVVYARG